MAISLATLNALTRVIVSGMNLKYRESVADKAAWRNRFAFPKSVNRRVVTLAWLYDSIRLEEQAIGQPPTYQAVYGESTTVDLKEYGAAVRIGIYDAAEDDTGEFMAQAQEIGLAAARFPEEQMIDALNNGIASYTMYDGQPLFSSTHSRNGNAYDNLLAGALDAPNLQAARTAMARFPTDKNEPSNIIPSDLVVPMELGYQARQLINNTLSNVATIYTENVLQGIMVMHEDARLTDPTDWFVMHTDEGLTHKPFVHLQHRDFAPMRIIPELDPNTDAYKIFREYRWWGRTLERVWPTHPFFFIRMVNA